MTTLQPPQVARGPRRGMSFSARVTLLIGGCFAVGLTGGAGAHAVLVDTPISTDTMATPQTGWRHGFEEAWSVGLGTDVALADGTPTPEILATPTHIAVLSASGQPTSRVSAFSVTASDTAPSAMWSVTASVGGIGDDAVLGRWWGENLVLMGNILPSDATALAGDATAGDELVALPGDILLTCSPSRHCTAWDDAAKKMWEKDLPGSVGSSGALVRERDNHVLVPVYAGSGTANVLDATSGTLSPLDTTSDGAGDAFLGGGVLWPTRDGWVAPNSDGTEILTWDGDGDLHGVQAVNTFLDTPTAFVVSPGGIPTSADYLSTHSAGPGPHDATSVTAGTPDTTRQCTTISVNTAPVTLPDSLAEWLQLPQDGQGACTFNAYGTVAASSDGKTVMAVLGGLGADHETRVVSFDMESSTIAWVSEPVGAAALVRPNLLVTVSTDGTTMKGWKPGTTTTDMGSDPAPTGITQTSPDAGDAAESAAPTADGDTSSGGIASSAVPPVPGAYAGAGGPIPTDATPMTAFQGEGDTRTAVIASPSGNIGCDLSPLGSGCGVQSLLESAQYGRDWVGARWYIPFFGEGTGVPQVRSQGGAAAYMLTDPQVVPYGTVVYYQSFVCASEDNGMTCWDTSTGRGVFVNHNTAIGF